MNLRSYTPRSSKYLMIALAALFLWSAPVHAQDAVCGRYLEITQGLSHKYQEKIVGRGLTQAASAMEIYVNVDTGTWTVVIVHTTGIACVSAAGTDWHSIASTKGERDG